MESLQNNFNEKDGSLIIYSSRKIIDTFLTKRIHEIPKEILQDPRFDDKRGCFVTLKLNDKQRTLRGCIGFPEPVYKLSKALCEASIASATQDPRFPPVVLEEMKSILLEVSILTRPTAIEVKSQKDIPSHIEIGKHGLIMHWSFGSGLLLPQVATEEDWDAEEFLSNLSLKSGANPHQWLEPGTRVLKFEARVFSEQPDGRVLTT
ncbi:MAG: TIGR00296 family protein [Nitrososphaerales archaeon]